MSSQEVRGLKGKIQLKAILECVTGLHIGASKENLEIGALDSPVVRDPLTSEPYIPGSSLKGKMRCLVEKAHGLLPKRQGGTANNPVYRHECDTREAALRCPVCRLFGSTGGRNNGTNWPARLKVRDLFLTNESRAELEQIDTGLLYTEWKFENALDRITSAANPRNLERVPRGALFNACFVYDVEDLETAGEDIENIKFALRLLEEDALGGHGSRGYGQVLMRDATATATKLAYYRETGDAAAGFVKEGSIDDLEALLSFFD